MATKSEIVKCLTVLASKIPNAKPAETLLRGYADSLAHVSIVALEAAFAQGLTAWKFFPALAEIFDVINTLTSPATLLPTPGDAWGIVLKEIAATGYYGKPRFDCKLIARTVENIGWAYLCSSEDQMADRAHFMKMYGQLKERAEYESKLLPQSLEMRERLQVQPTNGHTPRTLRPVVERPKELVAAPEYVIDILKEMSGKLAMVPDPKPEPVKAIPMIYTKMMCDSCNRKVDSRMGWTLGEACRIPIGEGFCTGRMVERDAVRSSA